MTFNEAQRSRIELPVAQLGARRGPHKSARRQYRSTPDCRPVVRFPILDISLSSGVRNLAELTDIAQYDLVPSLHRIAGVYRVETVGAKYREYVVQLDPARLLVRKLTPQDVVTGLDEVNEIESAGRVLDGHRMPLTVVTTDLHAAEQLDAVPVASLDGQPIYVRDIGSVELANVEDYIRTASEHGPAVLVGIIAATGRQHHVHLTPGARAIINDFRKRYPDVISFFLRPGDAGPDSSTKRARRDRPRINPGGRGGVAALPAARWSAMIAAVVVPCTILITFAIMSAIGMTLQHDDAGWPCRRNRAVH